MKKNHFRTIHSENEIISMIVLADAKDRGIMWQSRSQEERVIYPIDGIGIDATSKEVAFQFMQELDLSLVFPVHIKINPQNMIFKIEPGQFKFSGKSLGFAWPSEAKAIELRDCPRIKLDGTKSISMKPIEGNMEIQMRMLDMSRSGVGIICSESNSDFFYRHSEFTIFSGRVADVVHITTTGMKRGEIRVGLKFQSELSEEEFDELALSIL